VPIASRAEVGSKAASRAGEVARANSDAAYVGLADEIRDLRDRALSFRELADRLTEDGHTSRRDKPWNPTQVKRVLERIRARE
jgi:hypothetical protein